MKKRVLLLGSAGSAGINFIKALQLNSSIEVIAVDVNKYYLEMVPVKKKYLVTREKGKEKEYIDKINKIIKKERIDFVHAQPDTEVKILSDYRGKIKSKTFLPSAEAIDVFQDKWKTFEILSKYNIAIPKTYKIMDKKSLKDIFKNNRDIWWIRSNRGAGGKASLPVKTFEQANAWVKFWEGKGLRYADFSASEFLPGREISTLMVWCDGKLVCSAQKERMEWLQSNVSVSGSGTTTAIQKTVHDKKINELCTATIKAVEKTPQGVYVVDAKQNKNNIFCVTEVNPGRFFTTSLFYPTAGVNMPYIYVALGLSLPVPKIKPYNSVDKDIYWIRIADGGPAMVKEGRWTSNKI